MASFRACRRRRKGVRRLKYSGWERAIIVGASSGIGAELARQLGASGTHLALVARRRDLLEQVAAEIDRDGGEAFALTHDVRDAAAVRKLFQEATTRLGGLDLVIYAAGIMPLAGLEQYPTEEDIATIEVNLSGAVAWLNETAMRFSRAGCGTIIGISSVAGDRGRQGNPVYNATKAGLNTYLESLRARLARRGVSMLIAKPGYVRTALLDDVARPPLIPVASAEEAARRILAAARTGKRVVYVPGWWRLIMAIVRAMPAPLFERLRI